MSTSLLNSKTIDLKAGSFELLYEKGFIRYIKYGNDEVLRMIYFALRDENWGTVKPVIENEEISVHKKSFSIQYDCFHERNGKKIFHWKAMINGDDKGVITFEIQGKALEDILKNRAGFCILHPIQGVAGKICELTHADGSTSINEFPKFVAPDNPFKNIKAMDWKLGNKAYQLQFEGDIFETEDQRNWSDASYKTFCTPLDLPFPIKLNKGATVNQRIIFKANSRMPKVSVSKDVIKIQTLKKQVELPNIGVAASTETDVLIPEAIHLFKQIHLNHYRIDVWPQNTDWKKELHKYCINASILDLPLEVALHLSPNYKEEVEEFISICMFINAQIKNLILLSKDAPTTNQEIINYLKTIKQQFLVTNIGAGTDYNFAELNRNRFNPKGLSFISYSIQPQEHAFDDLSLIENIEAQGDTLRSAKNIYGERKAIHVSPLTLKKRNNPYANNPKNRILTNDQKKDERLKNEFGAVFTLGSIKSLAFAGASSITLFQTIGEQGIISENAEPYPVYYALKEILKSSRQLIFTKSSNPLVVDSLLFEGIRKKDIYLINYTKEPQKVEVDGIVDELEPLEIKIKSIF